jgi:hypothetical protein
MSEMTLAGVDTAVIDLFRVTDGRIVEHWDVMEEITPEETWVNSGKFRTPTSEIELVEAPTGYPRDHLGVIALQCATRPTPMAPDSHDPGKRGRPRCDRSVCPLTNWRHPSSR